MWENRYPEIKTNQVVASTNVKSKYFPAGPRLEKLDRCDSITKKIAMPLKFSTEYLKSFVAIRVPPPIFNKYR